MTVSLYAVHQRIQLQKTVLPVMYGGVDFSATPERYTDDISVSSMAAYADKFPPPPADMVARVRAYTMLGDVTADAYAALMPKYGSNGWSACCRLPAMRASRRCPTPRQNWPR